MNRLLTSLLSTALAFAVCACTAATPVAPPTPAGPAQLNVMVHDSFNISESVLKGFEQANNVKVNLLKSGDAGAVLNKAILSKDAPIADVIYGIDNTFMSRALNADILEVFAPAELSAIPEAYKLDASNRLTPVNYGYVSFNMDKAWLTKPGSTQPDSLRALARPEYLHTVVVQNAATSSPGLAFLMTTIAAFPAGSDYPWQQFWRDLVKNQAHVSPDWSDAYYTQFSGSSGKGPHAIVMSYATSPAAEVFYSEGKLSEPPTVNLDIGAFEQIEFAGVLKGTKQRELSQKFVAFLLSPEFQKDIPAQMWVYPAVKDTPLPDVYRFAAKPSKIYSLPPSEIDANRERWIQEWSKIIAGG